MPSLPANRRWARLTIVGQTPTKHRSTRSPSTTSTRHGKDLHGEPLGKYFLHTLGHSVGIDVHDPYDYDKPFEIGSVFTIEPGIYIPEEKIGVRIEDTFYVNDAGKLIDFAEKLPRTPEEVESAMQTK